MKVIYLGRSSFTSKKGTLCYCLNFGVPFKDGKGQGFRSEMFFVNQSEFTDFLELSTPCAIDADIRFVNGADALISYNIKSESMDLWD